MWRAGHVHTKGLYADSISEQEGLVCGGARCAGDRESRRSACGRLAGAHIEDAASEDCLGCRSLPVETASGREGELLRLVHFLIAALSRADLLGIGARLLHLV